MFSNIPRESEGRYSNHFNYAHVTKPISRYEWGQVEFYGRYYPAELHDPNDLELPAGIRVLVYAERGAALLVGLDRSIAEALQINPIHEVSLLKKIAVFPI